MKTFTFGRSVFNVKEISTIGAIDKEVIIRATGKWKWSWFLPYEEYAEATEFRFIVWMKNGCAHNFSSESEEEANKARRQCIAALESA